MSIRVLLVGASGVVGQQVLKQALAEPRVSHVIALTRTSLPPADKLENHVVDFLNLPFDAPWWAVDAVICTLGTTMKSAGTQSAFAFVDRDLPILVAQLARRAGATKYSLNSSIGANLNGNFYLRTKAEAENGIRAVAYPSYTIVRPSLIDADRAESRLGETIGRVVARIFHPLIPKHYRPVNPENIATALLQSVLLNEVGERIVESEELWITSISKHYE